MVHCRPRLCIEKCDANTSVLSKTYSVSTMVSKCLSDSTKETCLKNQIKNEPMKSSDKQYQTVQHSASNEVEVPEKYRNILKKSVVVNLIRYTNIEEAFHSNKLTENSDMYVIVRFIFFFD